VELMDGEIGVESVLGEGSTFWFTCMFGKQPQSAAEPVIPQADISGERVLVVDDNATNRRWLRALLKTWKCRPDEAANAETAYQKLRAARKEEDPFRIAILDMQMPDIDGETLGAKIKDDPEVRDTLLVMMTSLGERGDAARLEAVGFSAYLTKPIKQSVLRDTLESVLGCKQQAAVTGRQPIITRHLISESRRGKVRILLAEDNAINQKVALRILENLGYRADAVANGQEAIRSLEMLPYDLVLMDCQMPEMDGYEATRRIRDPNSKVLAHDIPIVAMTAHAMRGDREKCLEAGMNDYLTKPVLPQTLSEMLEKWRSKP
jgi:CheY-like chemotaxis protein